MFFDRLSATLTIPSAWLCLQRAFPHVVCYPGVIALHLIGQFAVNGVICAVVAEAYAVVEPYIADIVRHGVASGGEIYDPRFTLANIEADVLLGVVKIGHGYFHGAALSGDVVFAAALILEGAFQLCAGRGLAGLESRYDLHKHVFAL